jgi:hypothetical protein
MNKAKTSSEPAVTIRDLYPHLNDEQLKDAEENLNRYLELTLRIYDRVRQDVAAYARFKTLTGSAEDRYDEGGQRSKN